MFGILEFNKLNRKIEHFGPVTVKLNSIELNNVSDIILGYGENDIMRIIFYTNNIQTAVINAKDIKEVYIGTELFYNQNTT